MDCLDAKPAALAGRRTHRGLFASKRGVTRRPRHRGRVPLAGFDSVEDDGEEAGWHAASAAAAIHDEEQCMLVACVRAPHLGSDDS
jgi:hypothetical protein